jgi:tetratricopeptide (TPR) repeat protein
MASQAIELRKGFKFAWYRRGWALLSMHGGTRSETTRRQMLEELFNVRLRFPEDQWPHILHGWYLFEEHLHAEAWVSFLEAHRQDSDNADHLRAMGEASLAMGRLARAQREFEGALRLNPDHILSWRGLGATLFRLIIALDEIQSGGELVDLHVAFAYPGQVGPVELEEADPETLAHSLRLCIAVLSELDSDLLARRWAAALAMREEAFDDARHILEEILARAPGDVPTLCALAIIDQGEDDLCSALVKLEQAALSAPDSIYVRLRIAEVLRAMERYEEATRGLVASLDVQLDSRMPLLRALYEAWSVDESTEAAGAKVRELLERRPADGALLREAADLLEEEAQLGHAIGLLRHVLEQNPFDSAVRGRLGALLARSLSTRDEGIALLEKTIEDAPYAYHSRCALAYALAGDNTEDALDVLEPAVADDHFPAHDTLSYVLFKQGRIDEAKIQAVRTAAMGYGHPDVGLIYMAFHHLDEYRYDWGLVLSGLIAPTGLDDPILQGHADALRLQSHRLAGKFADILDEVRHKAEVDLSESQAFEIYYGARSLDRSLAAKAAELLAESFDEDEVEDRLEWTINAAECHAHLGDFSPLEQATTRVTEAESAAGWAQLAFAWDTLKRPQRADEAARMAIALDPHHIKALTAMEESALRQGDLEAALAWAQRMLDEHSYEHQGPERLGLLYAKMGDAERARHFAAIALDAAPYCHIAHRSAAVAALTAGAYDQARLHAEQALNIERPTEDDAGDDSLMILRALDGDTEGLERCIATLEHHHRTQALTDYLAHLRRVALAQRASSRAEASPESADTPQAP